MFKITIVSVVLFHSIIGNACNLPHPDRSESEMPSLPSVDAINPSSFSDNSNRLSSSTANSVPASVNSNLDTRNENWGTK